MLKKMSYANEKVIACQNIAYGQVHLFNEAVKSWHNSTDGSLDFVCPLKATSEDCSINIAYLVMAAISGFLFAILLISSYNLWNWQQCKQTPKNPIEVVVSAPNTQNPPLYPQMFSNPVDDPPVYQPTVYQP